MWDPMANSFLFELGTEEIPAGMILSGIEQLKRAFEERLAECSIGFESIDSYSTPRRLAVLIRGLMDRQPDREELISGPPKSVGLDREGKPTRAAEGFARKFDAAPEELEVLETEKGEYLVLRRVKKGETVAVVLQAILPDIISTLNWPKNMYWRESRFRFIRPLRWFVALWNGEIVRFTFEGVTSGRRSRGHRFLGDPVVEIPSAGEYEAVLKRNFVIADPEKRRRIILKGLESCRGDDELYPDEGLLETVRGSFQSRFLEIPKEVLITVMRFHQKYFALLDRDRNLAPAFLTVINIDGDPDGRIRVGHEKVLRARLEDAAFFWTTDQKRSLESRIEGLSDVLFQEKLGSYLEKTRRIERICRHLPGEEGLQQAARLSKTDLTTEMVRELTELQGIMGGLYARQEGAPENVWRAVYEHYRPVSQGDRLPETTNGALLSIADRIDTIVGCFCAGIVPRGSSDPFGIRRQAQGLVAILLDRNLNLSLDRLVDIAGEGHIPSGYDAGIRDQVLEFLYQRVRNLLSRNEIPGDVINAVMAAGVTTVADAFDRARALVKILGQEDFVALAVAFKRIRNILSGIGPQVGPDRDLLQEPSERALYEAFEILKKNVRTALKDCDYLTALREIAGVRKPVDRFFDDVLVMDEDRSLRRNRLALLQEISALFLSVADISEIVQQGGNDE